MSTALITGASAGIGRELALVFGENGYDLIVVARTRARLESVADEVRSRFGRRVDILCADLASPGAAAFVHEQAAALEHPVDVLVNNAGIAVPRPFVEADRADLSMMVQLNVVALTELIRAFLPDMVARGAGRILNIASIAAFQPTPMLSAYGATKAFVLSLTEGLSQELAGSGVTVTANCPGFVDTDLVRNAAHSLGTPNLVPSFLLLDPAAVAREAFDACMKGEVIRVSGWTYELLVQLGRLYPRWLVRNVAGLVARQYMSGAP
ncbi:MAG TPA: SDR family oxidoreductase [Candidatus Limnocylindrales bacterium]|nr:SDR family oxidoreductase [Candidatus Limnocylindrales bacterium]